MKKKAFSSEYGMVKLVVRFLKDKGYTVETEIPFFSQSIDIVGEKDGRLLAIEAKLSDWKRVLSQCRNHGLGADHVSIVMGSVSISKGLVKSAQEKGFGILHCSPRTGIIKEVLAPRKSKMLWEPERKHLMKNLMTVVRDPRV